MNKCFDYKKFPPVIRYPLIGMRILLLAISFVLFLLFGNLLLSYGIFLAGYYLGGMYNHTFVTSIVILIILIAFIIGELIEKPEELPTSLLGFPLVLIFLSGLLYPDYSADYPNAFKFVLTVITFFISAAFWFCCMSFFDKDEEDNKEAESNSVYGEDLIPFYMILNGILMFAALEQQIGLSWISMIK